MLSPLVAGLTLLALSSEALADPEEDTRPPLRRQRTSEILMRIEVPRAENGSWLDHVSIRKGTGLVYRHKVETDGDRKMVLSVGGPALKKGRYGLLFEVKF